MRCREKTHDTVRYLACTIAKGARCIFGISDVHGSAEHMVTPERAGGINHPNCKELGS